MCEPVINEDEMIGFIMRNVGDDHNLYYEDVRAVLDTELAFLKVKGLIETEKKVD